MKAKRMLACIMAAAIVAGTLTGAVTVSAGEMTRENTLVYGAEFEDTQFNPILSSVYSGNMMFRGLMKTDENCNTQNDIASNVEISDDLLKYTITIRNDVKFHDGSDLTVEDVIFTIESIMNENVNSSLRKDFEEVEKVEKVDDTTLCIKLANPFPALLDKLTVGIIPKHCFGEGEDINTAAFNMNPVGCGPYKFVSCENGIVVMTRFDDFYGDKAKIENVVYQYIPDYNTRAMQVSTGEVDVAYIEPSQVEQLEAGENTTVVKIPTADYRCVMYNFQTTDLFEDANVRKALNCATDREGLLESIVYSYGQVAYSPLQLNEYNCEDVEKYDYDMDKAAALLEEAGWTDSDGDGVIDKDGEKFAFTLTAPSDDEVRVNMATYLSSEWTKLGIDCKVEALDWSAIDIAKCDAFVLGWGSPFDADNDTYRLFTTGRPDNYGAYSNEIVDAALAKARITSDSDGRKECYAEFQKALAEDPAYDFICYMTALYGTGKRVTGLNPNKVLGHHGAGIFWNIEEWELQ